MKIDKYISLILILVMAVLYSGCSSVKSAFDSGRKNSSEEFLVEKKSPLVMPPDYNDLPVPDQNKETAETNENKIKDLVTKNENENGENNNSEDGNLDIEQSILKKIKN